MALPCRCASADHLLVVRDLWHAHVCSGTPSAMPTPLTPADQPWSVLS